jgi:hypothetical protein
MKKAESKTQKQEISLIIDDVTEQDYWQYDKLDSDKQEIYLQKLISKKNNFRHLVSEFSYKDQLGRKYCLKTENKIEICFLSGKLNNIFEQVFYELKQGERNIAIDYSKNHDVVDFL